MQAGGRRFDPDQLHQDIWWVRAAAAQGGCGAGLLRPKAAFRAGTCSGKERKPLAPGAYQDIRDRGSGRVTPPDWSGFRAGIFCSGKERKLAATGAYQDIRDRDASAVRRRRNKKDQAETGL